MKKEFEQDNSKFVMIVNINKRFPDNHTVIVHGAGYHKEKMCSTSELEDACAKMEYDARLTTKPAFEVEEVVQDMLKGIGFEADKDPELTVVKD
jgi:hypothetical protein